LERVNDSEIPTLLSNLCQLIKSLWNRQILTENRKKTAAIEKTLEDNLATINLMNKRIQEIADKGIFENLEEAQSEENLFCWETVRIYNSRLSSMKEWNTTRESRHFSIRSILSRALGVTVQSSTSILDLDKKISNPLAKAIKRKRKYDLKIPKQIREGIISEVWKARTLLQIDFGVFKKEEQIQMAIVSLGLIRDSTTYQLEPEQGILLYKNPNLDQFSIFEYIETLRSLYRLEDGEFLLINNSIDTTFYNLDPIMDVFVAMSKKSKHELSRCFHAARAIMHHFVAEERDNTFDKTLASEVIEYVKAHYRIKKVCTSEELNNTL
jgi:hypothetical protein